MIATIEQDTALEVEALKEEVAPVIRRAGALTVATPDQYTGASEFLKCVKAAQKRVADLFAPMKAKAHAAWKEITVTETATLDPLKVAEKAVKAKMLDYHEAQERIRRAEQRRLQAEADERARREREALERKAASMKTEAKQEEYREAAASVQAPVVQVATVAPVVKGQSIRKAWKARLDSLSVLTGIPEGDVRLSFVTFDQSAANRFAAATKGAVGVAGVTFYEEALLASRSR